MDLYDPRSSHPDAEEVHRTSKSRVFRFRDRAAVNPDGAPGDDAASTHGAMLFLKEEPYPFPAILQALLVRPRVVREFRNLRLLRSFGCPAVEPLAYGVCGFWPLYTGSFLITAEFAGAQTLKAWSRNTSGLELDRREVTTAMLGFARTLGRLHRCGYYMRTLYAKNILVRETDAGTIEIALCDMPRLWKRSDVFESRSRPTLRRFHFLLACFDVACLDKWGSHVYRDRERLRFLKVYLEELQMGPPRRVWVKRVSQMARFLRHESPLGKIRKNFRRFLLKYRLKKYWPF